MRTIHAQTNEVLIRQKGVAICREQLFPGLPEPHFILQAWTGPWARPTISQIFKYRELALAVKYLVSGACHILLYLASGSIDALCKAGQTNFRNSSLQSRDNATQ